MKRELTALLISVLLIFSVFLPSPVFAFTPLQIVDIPKVNLKVASCVVIRNSIENRISNFNTRYSNHLEVYTKLEDRLEQMIQKWQAWGYDTNDLQNDLDSLKTMVDEYKNDFENLTSNLSDAKDACGTSDYTAKMTEAKQSLKDLRGDVVDIRILYQTMLRKHILELKNQET